MVAVCARLHLLVSLLWSAAVCLFGARSAIHRRDPVPCSLIRRKRQQCHCHDEDSKIHDEMLQNYKMYWNRDDVPNMVPPTFLNCVRWAQSFSAPPAFGLRRSEGQAKEGKMAWNTLESQKRFLVKKFTHILALHHSHYNSHPQQTASPYTVSAVWIVDTDREYMEFKASSFFLLNIFLFR